MAKRTKRNEHGWIQVVSRPATTVSGVLKQALDLLQEENRWRQAAWFDGETIIDPQDPLCGSWGVCADGAVLAVMFGVPTREDCEYVFDEAEHRYVDKAVCKIGTESDHPETASEEQVTLLGQVRQALSDQVPDVWRVGGRQVVGDLEQFEQAYASHIVSRGESIVSFNDQTTYDDVIAVFRKAYRHAQYTERVQREQARDQALAGALASVA